MFVIFLIVLALLSFSALDHNFLVAFILGSLVWIAWKLHFKLENVTRKLTFLESQLSEQDNALAGDKTTETLKPRPLSDKSLDDLDHQPASGAEDVSTQAGVIDEKSDTPASHYSYHPL